MSATPTTYGWTPATAVATGSYYQFIVLTPPTWTAEQTQAYLDPDLGGKVGWDVKSIGAPPLAAQAALNEAKIVFPNGQVPAAYYVLATWPGSPGVLPTDPNIAYEQLSEYGPVPATTVDVSTSPTPSVPTAPAPSDTILLGILGAGVLLFGAIWLVKQYEENEREELPKKRAPKQQRSMIAQRRAYANPVQTIDITVNGRRLPFVVETDNGVNWTASTKVGRKRIVSTGSSKSEALQSAVALASRTIASADVRRSY